MVLLYYYRNPDEFCWKILFSLTIQFKMFLLKENACSALIAGGLQLSSMTPLERDCIVVFRSCISRAID